MGFWSHGGNNGDGSGAGGGDGGGGGVCMWCVQAWECGGGEEWGNQSHPRETCHTAYTLFTICHSMTTTVLSSSCVLSHLILTTIQQGTSMFSVMSVSIASFLS